MGTQKMQVVHNYKVFPLTKTPSCMVTAGQNNLGEGSLAVGSLPEAGEDRQTSRKEVVEPA